MGRNFLWVMQSQSACSLRFREQAQKRLGKFYDTQLNLPLPPCFPLLPQTGKENHKTPTVRNIVAKRIVKTDYIKNKDHKYSNSSESHYFAVVCALGVIFLVCVCGAGTL